MSAFFKYEITSDNFDIFTYNNKRFYKLSLESNLTIIINFFIKFIIKGAFGFP